MTPQPFTAQQARASFFYLIWTYIDHWAAPPRPYSDGLPRTTRDQLTGLGFGLLNIFDGTTVELPPFDLIVELPDGVFMKNRFENGLMIQDDRTLMHDLFYGQDPGPPKTDRTARPTRKIRTLDPQKAMTQSEATRAFIDKLWAVIEHWHQVDEARIPGGVRDRLIGIALGLLRIIDGEDETFPRLKVVASPHHSAEAYHKEQGESWYPPGLVINDGVKLHEELIRYRTRR